MLNEKAMILSKNSDSNLRATSSFKVQKSRSKQLEPSGSGRDAANVADDEREKRLSTASVMSKDDGEMYVRKQSLYKRGQSPYNKVRSRAGEGNSTACFTYLRLLLCAHCKPFPLL